MTTASEEAELDAAHQARVAALKADPGFKMLGQINAEAGRLPEVPPLEELTLTLFGAPGRGKTFLAAGRPRTIFAGTEPGQEFVGCPSVSIRSWDDFRQMVEEIYAAREKGVLPWECVTVDIIDNLAGYCMSYICGLKGLEYPPENDYGKTWKEVRNEWESWLRSLMHVVNVQFLSHLAVEKVEVSGRVPGSKKEVDCLMPTMKSGRQAQYLDGVVNAVGYIYKDLDGRHVVTFENTATCGAKDRTQILERLGPVSIQIDRAEMDKGRGEKLAWRLLSDAYAAKAAELGYAVKSRR